ncbi:MAG TPA: uroporphyrinogen-III C-methyltransferase [Terriglobales bacterium]|nr:uroporphyrinogen-III C-methyltransferase [Terriglobales bacterium]
MIPRARISFVGAGPGDPELITLKALRRIRAAGAIIHDRLIPPSLLDEARAGAEIIDVGKAPGRASMGQGQINGLLVEAARRHESVVRLKGGDPGIFGRLAEEIDAVRAAGIPFEVVPGVTSATAAAARVGISLTERGSACTLVLATGTGESGTVPEALDWGFLARVEGTLVFYMPVAQLDAITAALTVLGRDHREPALVIEAAGRPEERVVAARLGVIAERARAAGIGSPALFLTGPTVAAASVPLAVRRLAVAV